jgi:hypothetical protein
MCIGNLVYNELIKGLSNRLANSTELLSSLALSELFLTILDFI